MSALYLLEVCRDLTTLHPSCRLDFARLARTLDADFLAGRVRWHFLPFEAYRSPQRQDALHRAGKATRALPYESAHQYGLAVDFVPQISGKWTWDVPAAAWDHLKQSAERCGLHVPISWDRAHVQSPLADTAIRAFREVLGS